MKVPITDVETANKLMKLIDALDDVDDIQAVYSNLDLSDDVEAALAEED